MIVTDKVRQDFWGHVTRGDACWMWAGSKISVGYGAMKVGGKTIYAYRLSWLIATGEDPAAMHVCHRCDNPSCVRPDHLFLGTHGDNMRDMCAKGRSGPQVRPECFPKGDDHYARRRPDRLARGEDNGLAKLTEDSVLEIRLRNARGDTQSELAREYGVHQASIWRIVTGKTWRHVGGVSA